MTGQYLIKLTHPAQPVATTSVPALEMHLESRLVDLTIRLRVRTERVAAILEALDVVVGESTE